MCVCLRMGIYTCVFVGMRSEEDTRSRRGRVTGGRELFDFDSGN